MQQLLHLGQQGGLGGVVHVRGLLVVGWCGGGVGG